MEKINIPLKDIPFKSSALLYDVPDESDVLSEEELTAGDIIHILMRSRVK